MTKERIELIREILLPFVKENLTKINYEDQGKHDTEEFEQDFNKILNLAIKALEQESCKDAVSRQAVLNTFDFTDKFLDETRTVESYKTLLEECYKNLPSVTPTRKKGKWINKSQKSGCGITFVASECTCCGKKTLFNCDELIYKYCPNCGAKMDEESEEV